MKTTTMMAVDVAGIATVLFILQHLEMSKILFETSAPNLLSHKSVHSYKHIIGGDTYI